MGMGRKLGRGFLMVAKMGDEIDRGLNELFGENRTKAGQGFSKDRAGQRAAAFSEKSKNKDFFDTASNDKSEDLNFLDSDKGKNKKKKNRKGKRDLF